MLGVEGRERISDIDEDRIKDGRKKILTYREGIGAGLTIALYRGRE